jgi:hypothetical protein
MAKFRVIVTKDSTARSLSASNFPMDNSLPQSNEGVEYTQLQTTITPKRVGSTLLVEGCVHINTAAGTEYGNGVFLFKDSGADCVSGCSTRASVVTNYSPYPGGKSSGAAGSTTAQFSYTMTTSSLDSITFKVRVGADGGTVILNQCAAGLSSSIFSSLKITEIY